MSDRFDLSGKTALVTGASSGLGRHFAMTLAGAGAAVAVTARRADKLAETVEMIEGAGGSAQAFAMDVTDRDSVAESFNAIEAAMGAPGITVNNAGTARRDLALDVPPDHWDDIMATNLTGVWNTAQEAAKRMVGADIPGSIINIASLLALRVNKGIMPYAVSKAGVAQMTRALAIEWAEYNIRVNAIAPGYFITDLNREFLNSDRAKAMIGRIPQQRVGEKEELEGPLLLLASDAGAYMTGTVISVDGGHAVNSI